MESRSSNVADLDHKTRMISLRLSDVELEFLKKYQAYGAHSVSDFARLAVQRLMHGWENSGNHVTARLAALDGRISALESQMSLLTERQNGNGNKSRFSDDEGEEL